MAGCNYILEGSRGDLAGTLINKALVSAFLLVLAGSVPAPSISRPQEAVHEDAPRDPAAAGAHRPAWQIAWDTVARAARHEDKAAAMGPVGDALRQALADSFQGRYGIIVDYPSAQGPEVPLKVATERLTNQFLSDIYVGGTTSAYRSLVPIGAFDSREPSLILPEVRDPKAWGGGEVEFIDEGRTLVVLTPTRCGTLFVNPSLVKPDEFKPYKDLLGLGWKGPMVADDPRSPGPGQATFTFFCLHPGLGPKFIRALAGQQLLLTDCRQETDIVAEGRTPIPVAGNDYTIEPLMKQGAPITIVEPQGLHEGSGLNPGSGRAASMNRTPHPNSAKLYPNWLLSSEGQTALLRALGYVSAPLDVLTDHFGLWRIPIHGSIKTSGAEALGAQDKVIALGKELLGG